MCSATDIFLYEKNETVKNRYRGF